MALLSFIEEAGDVLFEFPDEEITYELIFPSVVNIIQSHNFSPSDIESIQGTLDEIYDIALAPNIFLNQVPDFIQSQRLRKLVNHTATVGVVTEFANTVNQITEDVTVLRGGDRRNQIIGINSLIAAIPQDNPDMLTCGIDQVDALLGGGIIRGKYVVLCAYTGFGKTVFGLQVARRVAETGYVARFGSLELSGGECSSRFLSSFCAYPYERIWKGDLSFPLEARKTKLEITEEVREIVAQRCRNSAAAAAINGNFGIWDLSYVSAPTIQTIEAYIKNMIAAGERLDCVVVDYIDLLQTPSKSKAGGGKGFPEKEVDEVSRLGKISSDLAKLAKKYDIVIWGLTQANDEGAKVPYPTLTSTRGSRAKNDPASVWLGLGGSQEDRELGVYTLNCDKNRDGSKFRTKIRGRLDIQTFAPYESDALTQEVIQHIRGGQRQNSPQENAND